MLRHGSRPISPASLLPFSPLFSPFFGGRWASFDKKFREDLFQRRLGIGTLAAADWLLVHMANRGHAGRLFDHDNLGIDILEADIGQIGRRGSGLLKEGHHILQTQTASRILANIAADTDSPGLNETPNLFPGLAGKPLTQGSGQCRVNLVRLNVKVLAIRLSHGISPSEPEGLGPVPIPS